MGYRLPDDRCPDRRKQIDDTARQSVIRVDNGTINHISIPSFYQEHRDHDKMLHDHLGWPYPGHPDKSCQLPPGCERILVLNEIDLPNEGYDAIEVSMIDPPEGLEFTGSIEYNVITLNITAMCPSATFDDLDVTFAAYATGTIVNGYDEEDVPLRDVVTKGVLHIVAGPVGTSTIITNHRNIDVISNYDTSVGRAICIFKIPKSDYSIDVIDPYGGHSAYERNFIYQTTIDKNLILTHNCNLIGIELLDGNALHEREAGSQYFQVIGIKNDTYVIYDKNVTCEDLIADGCQFGYGIWGVMVYDGEKIPVEDVIPTSETYYYNELVNDQNHVRDFIGDDSDFWYYGFMCGRNSASIGGVWQDVQDFLYDLDKNVNWYMIDGGGSAQCYVGSTNIVPYVDSGLMPNLARSRFLFTTYHHKEA